jgi:glycosyltransferase involved in cell wall biosynthesis
MIDMVNPNAVSGLKITLVIPCFNERRTIVDVVRAVRNSPVSDKEIIVVDDCSTDGKREILAQTIEPLATKVIYHKRNQGKGAALRSGFACATGDIVIIQDADLGFEPEITAKVAKLRCSIYEVGISYYGQTYEEGKKIGWKDGIWAIYCIICYNLFK